MAKKFKLYQIDSFTKEKFKGNPAGVITNADGLGTLDMQNIARELNNSETAFIFASDCSDHDVHVRFFTPTKEVPICGHATIAAHYALAVENELPSGTIYQKTGAGILPVEIIREKDDVTICMTQGKIDFGALLEGQHKHDLLRALNIECSDLLESHVIQIVSTGHSKVLIGIKRVERLHSLKPNLEKLIQLSKRIGCNGYYVYTIDVADAEYLVHGRMFAPAIGIGEDPVTGNANGPLGAYLVHHNLVDHNNALYKFKAIQGKAINREGTIDVEVKIENGEPCEVKIYGTAVIAFQSELMLDESFKKVSF